LGFLRPNILDESKKKKKAPQAHLNTIHKKNKNPGHLTMISWP
jgi:hypothetical protein